MNPSSILDVATSLGDLVSNHKGEIKAVGDTIAAGRVRSIAERARRCIMMYKVLISAGVRDTDVALKIVTYLENMYGIFTLIVLGYNPTTNGADNSGLNSIIDSVSAESFNFDDSISKRALSIEMLYKMDEAASAGPRIGKRAKSTEASNSTFDDARYNYLLKELRKLAVEYEKANNRNLRAAILAKKEAIEKEIEQMEADKNKQIEAEKEANDKAEYDALSGAGKIENKLGINPNTPSTQYIAEAKFIDAVAKKSANAYPVTIQMKVKAGISGGEDISVPIAIKCNAYPVGSEELRLLIESGIGGKTTSFLRKMKWRTGEISTMDYIFNTDIAKRDKQLYAKLGRNPWYVELQKRKAASNNVRMGKMFSSASGSSGAMADSIQNLSGYRGEVPPTASLIVTAEDLVAATRLNIENFTKNEGFINNLMKELFLLCFGIVDHTTEQIKFFFMGYTSPFIVSFKELEKIGKDPNADLNETIKNLSRKV